MKLLIWQVLLVILSVPPLVALLGLVVSLVVDEPAMHKIWPVWLILLPVALLPMLATIRPIRAITRPRHLLQYLAFLQRQGEVGALSAQFVNRYGLVGIDEAAGHVVLCHYPNTLQRIPFEAIEECYQQARQEVKRFWHSAHHHHRGHHRDTFFHDFAHDREYHEHGHYHVYRLFKGRFLNFGLTDKTVVRFQACDRWDERSNAPIKRQLDVFCAVLAEAMDETGRTGRLRPSSSFVPPATPA